MRQSKVVKMLCAIPPDVRAWVEEKAALDMAPMNSIIVAALRVQMDAERRQASSEAAG